MSHTDGTHTPPSHLRDDVIPTHVSEEHQGNRHVARTDEHLELDASTPSSTSTVVNRLTDSSSVAKGSDVASADSGSQASLTETTPLISRREEHVDPGSRQSNTLFPVLWEEAKTIVKYALPVFGTHVFEHSIIMSSVIAIGHISTIALAASSIGFMTANVTGLSIIQGMTAALDTILPSAWTSSEPHLVGLWTQRMVVLQLCILIPIYVVWFNSEAILLTLKQDPAVARYAAIYLKWASLSLPAYSFNTISRRYFQAQGLFDVPARIIFFVAPINILLTYLLVWGPESIRIGFIGAPIATSISYNLISVASVVYGLFFVKRTAWHPITTQCFTSLGMLARLCVGSVGQVASEWWSWELVGLAASFLGPTQLASQSVLISTVSTTFQPPFAIGIATSVRVGNLLGEKNATRAGVAANAAMLLCVCVALCESCILLTFRATWAYMFNSDPEVAALVAAVLPVVAFVQLFDSFGAVIAGILRARGKQTLGAIINVSAYYCLGFPIGFWLAFARHWGLPGLWWGLTIAMTWVCALGTYLCLSTDWQREVEKVMARLAVDKAYQQRRRDEEYVPADGNHDRS